jgi:predicted  nucleic acid-binding Zn-ribbon protein
MNIDPWDEEWDRKSHSESEYRRMVRELRGRIGDYLKEIEHLQMHLGSVNAELMRAQDDIETLHTRLRKHLHAQP